jgi:hypothetical protein
MEIAEDIIDRDGHSNNRFEVAGKRRSGKVDP